MSRLKPKHWQRRRLPQQLKAASDARTYRRTLAVLELDRGGPPRHRRHARRDPAERPQLGRRPSPATRPVGPCDEDRSGRPPSWPSRPKPPAVPDGPVAPGPRLSARRLDGASTPAGIGAGPAAAALGRHDARGLRRLGYVWKRPRYVLDPDPEREEKTADSQANQGPAAPSIVLAQDETDLLMFPPLRAGWRRGANRRRSTSAAGTPGG